MPLTHVSITEEACITLPIHARHERRVVGPVAHRRPFLLAELACTACCLEGNDNLVADVEGGDGGTDAVDNAPCRNRCQHREEVMGRDEWPTSGRKDGQTSGDSRHSHEFVSKDVTFLQAQHLGMVEVQVGTTDCRPRDLDNHVLVLRDIGDGRVNHPHILVAEPGECSHRRAVWAVLVRGTGGGYGGAGCCQRFSPITSCLSSLSTGPIMFCTPETIACMVAMC